MRHLFVRQTATTSYSFHTAKHLQQHAIQILQTKTLYPPQQVAADKMRTALLSIGGVLNTSETGTGKTVMSASVVHGLQQEYDCAVGVVCPKSVIPNWEQELLEWGVDVRFVLNPEKLRRGVPGVVSRVRKKNGHGFLKGKFNWHLPQNTVLIVDEVQFAKSQTSQNANIMCAAVAAGYRTLNLSATPANDVTEMRYLGYALRLHNNNFRSTDLPSFFSWLKLTGCSKDAWGGWYVPKKAKPVVAALSAAMYEDRAVCVRRTDMPEAFRKCNVATLYHAMADDAKNVYEDAGLTPAIVETYVESGKLPKEQHVLTELIRARQLAEASKVAYIAEFVSDWQDKGYNVCVFVNYRETVDLLLDRKPEASVVVGGQHARVRKSELAAFQAGDTNVVICNSAAGGTGVNLHDTLGDKPRVSIIVPDWNPKTFKQVLGRTDRAGMQSDAHVYLLVARGTVEEKVLASLRKKVEAASLLFQ